MEGENDSRLSMLQKSELRSYNKKYLHGNFTAGHKQPIEHYLSRVGLRGRKRWLCLALLLLVYLFAIAHLALTCFILGVLRFDHTGSPHLVWRDDGSLVFPRGAALSNVQLSSPASVSSYTDTQLHLNGAEESKLKLSPGSGYVSVEAGSVGVATQSLLVGNSRGDQLLSVMESEVVVPQLSTTDHQPLRTETMTVNTVNNVSDVRADEQLSMRSSVGVTIQARQLTISTPGRIALSSQSGVLVNSESLVLAGLPTMPDYTGSYQLCACGNGTIFTIQYSSAGCMTAASLCTSNQ